MAHALVRRHVERLLVGGHHVLGRGYGSASEATLRRTSRYIAVQLQVVAAVLRRLALLPAVGFGVVLTGLFPKAQTPLVIVNQTILRDRWIDNVPTAVLSNNHVLLAT